MIKKWGLTYNLRQVEGIIANGVEDKVLKPIDDIEEIFSEVGHRMETRRASSFGRLPDPQLLLLVPVDV